MGAWGTGIFQDDSALDFLDALREEPDPIARLRQAFEAAVGAEYLDYDEGEAALVCAAVVDAVLRGTGLDDGDEEVAAWLSALDVSETTPLRPLAANACRRLLAPASELRELWEENEEEFPRWRDQIEQLGSRLAGRGEK